ncbi:uncharacterized protein LOC131858815 [Cryptomeria japonica]|uniref:uncharacterized protein LOC131858815 n=1 Tax=Cryptomeria japonica TaxID=3369 RepID=UPI0027DA772D|nr:uncharacterized protein LOC131858815 [Cryptomeria japonica]
MARSMIEHRNVPKKYWAEAVYTAVYLLNRSPTHVVKKMTPEEAWSGRKPKVGHLKVFGSTAHAYMISDNTGYSHAKSGQIPQVEVNFTLSNDCLPYPPNTSALLCPETIAKERSILLLQESATQFSAPPPLINSDVVLLLCNSSTQVRVKPLYATIANYAMIEQERLDDNAGRGYVPQGMRNSGLSLCSLAFIQCRNN